MQPHYGEINDNANKTKGLFSKPNPLPVRYTICYILSFHSAQLQREMIKLTVYRELWHTTVNFSVPS